MNWCVVIPTFNNEKTLERVIQDVLQVTPNVIVVNDGSTDSTPELLSRFGQITVHSFASNRGKGHALKKGFEIALRQGFKYAITLDSDGQHFASDIVLFVKKALEFPESLIIGARTLPEEKLRKGSGFANRISNFWFRLITGLNLPDTQSGFRLYPLSRLQEVHFYTGKYEFELEVLVRSAWKGIPVLHIPISVYYPSRQERVSHFRPFMDFMRIGLLHTVFVFIALFYIKPFSFLKYLNKESASEFIKKHLIHTGDSHTKTTLSVMLGIFMGIAPIWGYQLITAIALAYLFRLNKFIVIVAANISIPPMIPLILYLSYLTGGIILHTDPVSFNSGFWLETFRENLFQYILGSVVFAVIASLCFGIFTLLLLKGIRRKKGLIR